MICGHCGATFFSAPIACCVCGAAAHCMPCPKVREQDDRIAELEEKMRYLDNIHNVPGLKEKAACALTPSA